MANVADFELLLKIGVCLSIKAFFPSLITSLVLTKMVPNTKQQNQENNFYLNLMVFNTKKVEKKGGTDSLGDYIWPKLSEV